MIYLTADIINTSYLFHSSKYKERLAVCFWASKGAQSIEVK